MNLYQNISRFEDSELCALYYENKEISYKKLMINIRKLASYFAKRGIKSGDVVTVSLPNVPLTIYVFYALNLLGVTQNIIHPLTTFDNIIESMKKTNSNKAIMLANLYKENKEFINNSDYDFFLVNPLYNDSVIKRYVFYVKYPLLSINKNVHLIDEFYKEKEIENIDNVINNNSIYLHSGGTSGEPKVIVLSDDSINNLVSKMDSIVNVEMKGKSMLAVLPTFHGFGLGMGIHAPLANGATITLLMKFNAKKIVKYINKGKVNFIIGVPLLYQKLMKYEEFSKAKLNNLECVFIGGDNVSTSLINEFNKLMKDNNSNCQMLEGYGLTETVTVCSVNTKKDYKIGSVGKALRGLDIVVLDDEFKQVDPYVANEVYVSGDTLMNGYLYDVKTTEKTLLKIDDKIYVRTGDIGYLDEEGFLFLKGRKKRMYKISGMNIYPSEIEKIVCEFDEVFDASLEYYDIPSPSLVLFLIKNKNSSLNDEELTNKILDELSKKVLKYSLPKKIIYLNEFPKTKVGKIDHNAFLNPFKK